MIRRMLLAAVFVLFSVGCAKIVVVPVSPGLNEEGVFYALPKTVVRVVLNVDREEKKPAPYAMFGAIFAPDVPALCETIASCRPDKSTGEPLKTTAYSIQQGAAFSSFGEPDPRHVFLVKFQGGGAIDQEMTMSWNEMGLVSTAAATVTNRSTDIAVAGLKLAAGLGTKASAGAVSAAPPSDPARCPEPHPNDEWIKEILGRLGGNQADNMLIANYCDLPRTNRGADDEISRDDFNRQTDERMLERATEAYRLRVLPLVTRRTAIIGGGSNILDPVAFINKLDTLIDEQLKALFVGSESKKTWDAPFEIRRLDPMSPEQILGLDGTKGICPVTALLAPDAKPLPSGFRVLSADECKSATPVTVSVDFHPARAEQLFEKVRSSVTTADGDRSFRYVLPARVKGVVSGGTKNYGAALFSVAQLGHVVSLPAHRNGKKIAYDLAMIEATGGLKTFKLGTTGGLDAATIDALAGAGGTVLDARNARRKEEEAERKAEEAAADELAVLTRQSTLLKLKDQICEIQKKYGLACTIQP
jgi:hypothetical protein